MELVANYFDFFAAAFCSILPDPLHLVQLSPAFAASTQHGCAQILPSPAALVQQPATLFSTAAASAKLAAEIEITANAIIDLENFFMCFLGDWCGRRESNPPLMLGKHT